MLREVSYDYWLAHGGDILMKSQLIEIDAILNDGTILWNRDWNGQAYYCDDGRVIEPVYEDDMFENLEIVGYMEV